ncbi:MAG: YeeE/YedE family protein [Betaproteobacteria bacterium]|nr:YeeE/YedE family protein [Betaproteobacteria bacterium]
MGKHISIVVAGLIFGLGLALSGMTHASKVLGFLDVTGDWDPSLLLVLGGAVAVTVVAFRFILRRPAPVLEDKFKLPVARVVDGPLVVGAAIFGIGWGISGYCPGPGIALLAAPGWETWVFISAVLVGAFLHKASTSSPGGVVTRPRTTDG